MNEKGENLKSYTHFFIFIISKFLKSINQRVYHKNKNKNKKKENLQEIKNNYS